MSEFKLPTETIELPSKGLLYPEDSELAKGVVEIKYMTAKEEDILLNQGYIKNGTALDKLMKAMIVSPINFVITGINNANIGIFTQSGNTGKLILNNCDITNSAGCGISIDPNSILTQLPRGSPGNGFFMCMHLYTSVHTCACVQTVRNMHVFALVVCLD